MSEPSLRGRRLDELLTRSYAGRRVLVTGHNGFVGSWLTSLLVRSGAEVSGLSLTAEPGGTYETLGLDTAVQSIVGDLCDSGVAATAVRDIAPEVVFHLAAQALVLPSFDDPLGTLTTNVMGTAHVLEALRCAPSVRACVVVTSDKCYALADRAHEEGDALGGEDPYSASKAGAEIVAQAYRSSFFRDAGPEVATARAGNIVGGGDWADHRIVPDCVRAVLAGEAVSLRHPDAVRPWQHVLDAVAGYVRLGDGLLTAPGGCAEAWNFGPPPEAAATVGEVARLLVTRWRALGTASVHDPISMDGAPRPERATLTLVSEKAERRLGWSQLLDLTATIDWTADWYHAVASRPPGTAFEVTSSQIAQYLELDAAYSATATPDLVTAGEPRQSRAERP